MNDRRKELKRQYKESRQPMGVYRVRNKANGKVLLGSSPNLNAVWNKLRMQLSTSSFLLHPELQRDWAEFGPDAFAFEVLEELEVPAAAPPSWNGSDDLAALLEIWCEQIEPWGERGYNRAPKEVPEG